MFAKFLFLFLSNILFSCTARYVNLKKKSAFSGSRWKYWKFVNYVIFARTSYKKKNCLLIKKYTIFFSLPRSDIKLR